MSFECIIVYLEIEWNEHADQVGEEAMAEKKTGLTSITFCRERISQY
jgi:hypothetical protein